MSLDFPKFDNIFKTLTVFFNKTLTDDVLQVWFQKFQYAEESIFKEAVNLAIDEERYFPTPKSFFAHYDRAKEQVRKQRINSENAYAKGLINNPASVGFKIGPHGQEYLDEAIELFRKSCSEELLGFDLADAMHDLGAKYKINTYNREANIVLKNYFDRQGVPENKRVYPRVD